MKLYSKNYTHRFIQQFFQMSEEEAKFINQRYEQLKSEKKSGLEEFLKEERECVGEIEKIYNNYKDSIISKNQKTQDELLDFIRNNENDAKTYKHYLMI